MNGFIRKAAQGTCLGAFLALLTGCVPGYYDCVDPCWPERYNFQARQSVRGIFNVQGDNGHVLEQTIWNQHFEPGSDRLSKAGEDHLRYLARRRPSPDLCVFVQTAWDVSEDKRADKKDVVDGKEVNTEGMDAKRRKAVQKSLEYLTTLNRIPLTAPCATALIVQTVDFTEPGLRSRGAKDLYVSPSEAAFERKLAQEQTLRTGTLKIDEKTASTSTVTNVQVKDQP